MAFSALVSRIGFLTVLFWAFSCMNESPSETKPPVDSTQPPVDTTKPPVDTTKPPVDTTKPPVDTTKPPVDTTKPPVDTTKPPVVEFKGSGIFRIVLTEKSGISQGLSTILGRVYDGPVPASFYWRETMKSGSCTLYTPEAPFCEPGCGSNASCVSGGVCMAFPKVVEVGKVTVTGMKNLAGATTFAMEYIFNGYQPPSGMFLEYPPFAEGDPISISAAGDTGVGAFVVNATGISRLVLLNDSIVLEDGKAVQLRWTPPGMDVGSIVSVRMDISHHGGSKGKIECETADNGSLDISASLVDALKALGISGWPGIDITRRMVGTHAQVGVNLIIEAHIFRSVGIPGLISCTGDEGCPDGKFCQQDMQCE